MKKIVEVLMIDGHFKSKTNITDTSIKKKTHGLGPGCEIFHVLCHIMCSNTTDTSNTELHCHQVSFTQRI